MSNNKSRMQRNAKLHEELLNEKQERIETKELSVFANQLNDIDSQFERMDIEYETDKEYKSPLHLRNDRYAPKKQVAIEDEKIVDNDADEEIEGFSNDYLENFINEVKQYNVEMGYRKTADTRSNVLSSIEGWQSHLRPFGDIETIQEEKELTPLKDLVTDEEIISEPQETIEEPEITEPQEPPLDEQETIMMEVQRLSELSFEETIENEDIDETLTYEVIESPDEISPVQKPEEQDQEIKKSKSEVFFDVLLYLLIFASIIVIGLIIYIILKINNII